MKTLKKDQIIVTFSGKTLPKIMFGIRQLKTSLRNYDKAKKHTKVWKNPEFYRPSTLDLLDPVLDQFCAAFSEFAPYGYGVKTIKSVAGHPLKVVVYKLESPDYAHNKEQITADWNILTKGGKYGGPSSQFFIVFRNKEEEVFKLYALTKKDAQYKVDQYIAFMRNMPHMKTKDVCIEIWERQAHSGAETIISQEVMK